LASRSSSRADYLSTVKQIKSLTLSLVRTTTIFRPRPYLDAGSGYDGTSPDGDIDADACHTQTTRKKVAESTLEMGKKGSKGVTAKGNWMGVEGGQSADFSHFLLVPVSLLFLLSVFDEHLLIVSFTARRAQYPSRASRRGHLRHPRRQLPLPRPSSWPLGRHQYRQPPSSLPRQELEHRPASRSRSNSRRDSSS
jgi:hypothetical protein